jgi:HK97 family phage portal protein
MTIPVISTLFSYLGRQFNKTKNIFTSLLNIGGGPLIYPDINQENAITKGYEGNGVVYSVVSKDARKFASIPRYLYKKTKDGDNELVENDLSILLNRPNEYQGQDAFFEAVRGFYKITGEAFIWLNRGDTDKVMSDGSIMPRTDEEIDRMPVIEMYVLPSNRVYLVPDPGNMFGIVGYEFDAGGKKIPIRKNDVIHWKSTSLSYDTYERRHLRGMPALKPGNRFLQQNNDATDSATRMFQNDGARGLAYNETYNDLTPTQQSDVRDVVDKRVNNNDIKGAIATVQGKWGYVNFGGTAVDLELINALKASLQQMCMLFDVPFEFFIDTTYENKNQAMRGWVLHSILPACKQLDDELNRILLKAFNLQKSGMKICCDHTELPELQEDMSKIVTQLAAAWWITPNEKREVMGYEKLKGKEFDEPWLPVGITPLSTAIADDGFDDLVDEVEEENAKSEYV